MIVAVYARKSTEQTGVSDQGAKWEYVYFVDGVQLHIR